MQLNEYSTTGYVMSYSSNKFLLIMYMSTNSFAYYYISIGLIQMMLNHNWHITIRTIQLLLKHNFKIYITIQIYQQLLTLFSRWGEGGVRNINLVILKCTFNKLCVHITPSLLLTWLPIPLLLFFTLISK